jgi:hypothetical protein
LPFFSCVHDRAYDQVPNSQKEEIDSETKEIKTEIIITACRADGGVSKREIKK